ncbi:DUF6383 domain-containing protein [Massilibacteroides sp.]|uniref:DUF6383 domain-containing protein n=1 Tax=Massilibacteroides sp. TaxID=2034766 RepID=UPI0026217B85|nr:DUF6383 domain-containing protein [Massilibacteroides sp.]MDD4513998.1 DUF6383 domain-containing protein [Massilibacteroides sp.]
MKKKFFTLLAAAAFLLGTAVPAFSAVPHTTIASGAMVGGDAANMVVGANRGLYHITNVDTAGVPQGVLYVDNTGNTGAVSIENPLTSSKFLMESLWCVEITTEAQGKNPSFSFLNKAYGDNLRAEEKAVSSLTLDGTLSDWKFSNVYGENVALEKVQPLYSYINGSQAIVLVEGAGGVGTVGTAIADVTEIEAKANSFNPAISTIGGGNATMLFFTLNEATPIVLTADQFNTKLGIEPTATGQKLTFDPDRNVGSNPFTENVLKATNVATNTGGADWYLNLQNTDGKYLRVDTSVVNNTGNYFLTFKFTDRIEDGTLPAGQLHPVNLTNQYAFRFVYFPSHDSLIINVKDVLQSSKTLESALTPVKLFWEIDALLGVGAHGDSEGKLQSSDDVYSDTRLIDFTYVVLQDLNNNKVVTIGELPSQTRISLGLGDCKAAVNKTSLQGLYTIQNKEGKYLQVPIYTDTLMTGKRVAQWVTLESYVDPMELPSFQWVVEKVRSNDTDNISLIKITNREYANNAEVETIQLWKDKSTTLFDAELAANAVGFTEVPEAKRLDPYLGYKYVPEDIAKLRTYTFNYLHELDQNTYLSVKNSQSDSLLYVQKDNADGFELVPYHHSYTAANGWSVKPVDYGYTGSIEKINNKAYAAKLVRTAYVLKIKEGNKIYNTNKVVVVDKEGRYAVTPDNNNAISAGDSAVFYLKANNTKDGINYYALVDTASFTKNNFVQNGNLDRVTVKGGVTDHNLWLKVQNHYEVRTSAFAVEPNEEPLYRRFNRTVDGIENGATNFYDDVDLPVNLRFFRVNNESEFLYEDEHHPKYSEGKGINFLGYRHEADFSIKDELSEDLIKERTTLFVDTAFVNRPATEGAEFDTPKPQYLIGVGVYEVEGFTTEIPCEPSVTTPSYYRGRYLINATDSVYGATRNSLTNWTSKWQGGWGTSNIDHSKDNNKDGINDYIWDTKWERLAFVDAVRLYDTLYVLNGATEYADPIDFAKLKTDKRVHAIRLDNNFHKDVVWQFRLIDTEKGVEYKDQVQNFLIESETTKRGQQEMLAPMTGGWVKVQNGVPVISRGNYTDAITDAEKFNVVASDAQAVSNEDINVTDVNVVAGNGEVTIYNAAGKTVAISNILGQTIVNTVITSDNATIAAPKGIVVVAVQGEKAVKAIVK